MTKNIFKIYYFFTTRGVVEEWVRASNSFDVLTQGRQGSPRVEGSKPTYVKVFYLLFCLLHAELSQVLSRRKKTFKEREACMHLCPRPRLRKRVYTHESSKRVYTQVLNKRVYSRNEERKIEESDRRWRLFRHGFEKG